MNMIDIDHRVLLVNHNKLLHIVNIEDLYNLDDNDKRLVEYMDHVHKNHQIVVLNQDLLFNTQVKTCICCFFAKDFYLPGHMHGLQTCVEPNLASP